MSISMFHDADIGIYGYRVQNVDIDVTARFQMTVTVMLRLDSESGLPGVA
jgi:hypothetical protein